MASINAILKKGGYVEDNRADMGTAFENVISSEHKEAFPAGEIQKYIGVANQLANSFDNFDMYHKENDFFEVSRLKAIRQAERIDQWKLWRDKFIRWSIGVVVAVFMYSMFVYASVEIDFIKIPVRDLVIGNK